MILFDLLIRDVLTAIFPGPWAVVVTASDLATVFERLTVFFRQHEALADLLFCVIVLRVRSSFGTHR